MARLVELPLEVHWSFPFRSFDLDDDDDRRFVYETVLRQGNTSIHGVKVTRRWASPRSKSA